MIKGTQISGAGCEGGRRSGKHWSWILIKSLNVWRLDSLSPPDSNNLPHFLGASLSSSAPPPPAYLRRSPPLPFPPRRLPVIYAKRSLHLRALLMCFFFSRLLNHFSSRWPCRIVLRRGRRSKNLPQRAVRHSQNIWQLSVTSTSSCLEVSELCHRPQTGSGEPGDCQLSPKH